MTLEKEILSDVIIWSKYAKYNDKLKRRETWEEIVDRYEDMMIDKYPKIEDSIRKNTRFIREKKVLPSMRALQFAGPAMEVNHARGYNCCYLPVDSYHAFSETMFLLLGGTGVGYSVQKHHVQQLGAIHKPIKTKRYIIQDSIIGWADAVKALIKSYVDTKGTNGIDKRTVYEPLFDFSDIRKKGSRLVTAGGKAPGPEPLKECLFEIQKILDRKENGEFLTPLECHDIMCYIANAVLAGGIRRAAMISLFSIDDNEMLTCKYGNWWELNEQRGRANNSVILERGKVTEKQFKDLWTKIELSGSGEPGFYWTNDRDWGTNPCCEAALRPFQFCNKCEINMDDIIDQNDLQKRAVIATFFGTLQAGFTDFHYLRPIWKKTTEEDALIGVGGTGIASGKILNLDLSLAAEVVVHHNQLVAKAININQASRTTWLAPSGTTSCVLGTSSGIHAWHDEFFLRTLRFNMNEDIASYMLVNHPELCEIDKLRSDVLCVRIPIKAPEGSILRGQETAIDLLERVKKFSAEWIKPGHMAGINTHNVSATISINKDNKYEFVDPDEWYLAQKGTSGSYNEWEVVGEWMWENKEFYNGLAVLPFDGGTYVQAPFESISKEEYKKRVKFLHEVDLTKISEIDDNTTQALEISCAGGKCELV